MKRALIIVLIVFMSGCASFLVRPIEWTPVADFTPPALRSIFSTTPVKVLAMKEVPFDGFLLSGPDYQAWKARDARLLEEIDDLKGQIRDDRDFSTRHHLEVSSALIECRKSQPRTFAAGVGTGAGGCALLDMTIKEISN